jgi:hypothetical protein
MAPVVSRHHKPDPGIRSSTNGSFLCSNRAAYEVRGRASAIGRPGDSHYSGWFFDRAGSRDHSPTSTSVAHPLSCRPSGLAVYDLAHSCCRLRRTSHQITSPCGSLSRHRTCSAAPAAAPYIQARLKFSCLGHTKRTRFVLIVLRAFGSKPMECFNQIWHGWARSSPLSSAPLSHWLHGRCVHPRGGLAKRSRQSRRAPSRGRFRCSSRGHAGSRVHHSAQRCAATVNRIIRLRYLQVFNGNHDCFRFAVDYAQTGNYLRVDRP